MVDDFGGVYELDLTEVEREICRLPDVSISRLVAEPSGRVSEVHVVAHPGKHPKQIARDVQSVALASFGLELDRRIISVVQLGGDSIDPQILLAHPRPSVVAITAEANGLRSLVRVTLGRDEEEAVGFAEGSIATTARHRLVASATVDALRQLEPAAECIDIDSAQIVRVDAHDIAVVTVVFVTPPSEQLVSDRRSCARCRRTTQWRARCSTRPTGAWDTSASPDAPDPRRAETYRRCP